MTRSFRADEAAPAKTFPTVTPDDDVSYSGVRAVFVGTGGNIALVDVDGNTSTFKNVSSGDILPVAAVKVMATNTTAQDIILLK